MAQLVEAIEGMAEACEAFGTPITGGNVSLYNETLGEPVRPSPVMGIVGLMKTEAPAPVEFPEERLAVVLLGGPGSCEHRRFGGTQYAKVLLNDLWGLPPELDIDLEKRVQAAVREIVRAGIVRSAHDVGGGGLAVALAECSFGDNGVAAAIHLESDMREEFLLFHEAPSRVIVSTNDVEAVRSIASKHGIESPVIGETRKGRLEISNRQVPLLGVEARELRRQWNEALPLMLAKSQSRPQGRG